MSQAVPLSTSRNRIRAVESLGPNPYNHTTKFTIRVPEVQRIKYVNSVEMTNSAYSAKYVSHAGNLVTLAVFYSQRALTHSGVTVGDHAPGDVQLAVAVSNHAVHAHDIIFNNGGAAANAVTVAANSLRQAGGAAITVTGAGADGGVQNNGAAQAHAYGAGVALAHAVNQPSGHTVGIGTEVQTGDAVDMSGITFRMTVTA